MMKKIVEKPAIAEIIELEQGSGSLAKLFSDIINIGLQFGGEQVAEDQYFERLAVCGGCEKAGKVTVAGLEMSGCTVCGCPFATKPRWKKYYSARRFRIVICKCPHEKGNKWAEVDSNY